MNGVTKHLHSRPQCPFKAWASDGGAQRVRQHIVSEHPFGVPRLALDILKDRRNE